ARQGEPVQGGEDIEKRAAGTGREEQALGGKLAPRHYLSDDEYETQAERDPDQVRGDAPPAGFEDGARGKQEGGVEVENRRQAEVPPIRGGAPPHHHGAGERRERHRD